LRFLFIFEKYSIIITIGDVTINSRNFMKILSLL